jgi:virginiamycin A acetyltransferase
MRSVFVWIANANGLILALPWIVWSKIGLKLKTERPYLGSAYSLAIVPGVFGILLRRAFYRYLLSSAHWDLLINFGSAITHPTARLGRQVYIGSYCLLGRCRIGDHVLIASRVSIPSGRHQHQFEDARNISSQGSFEEVDIGANVWIGEGAIVMANVGPKAVVGAGAVVVKPVQQGAVVAGNPARPIRETASGPLA